MKKNKGRRTFLKNISLGGASAAILSTAAISENQLLSENADTKVKVKQDKRKYNEAYSNENLDRIAFPMGGIGAGMICMEGTGALSHISIRNRPDIFNEPGIFAAIFLQHRIFRLLSVCLRRL